MPNAFRSLRMVAVVLSVAGLLQLHAQTSSISRELQAQTLARGPEHRPSGLQDGPEHGNREGTISKGATQRALGSDSVSTPVHGGVEYRILADGMSFFSRTIAGATMETSYRWPSESGTRDGHFSIGFQFGFWPVIGAWRSLPFDIGKVTDLRVNDRDGEDGTVRFGSVIVQPRELFLVTTDEVPIRVTGSFYTNPITSSIFKYERTRITNMRVKMAGVNVPIRWYFGEERPRNLRFFLEGGVGFDLLMVKAEYEVRTWSVMYDQGTNTVTFDESTVKEREPLGGDVSNNLLLSHGSFGGGLTRGRFMLFGQARFLMTKSYTSNHEKFTRVRGNLLVLPALAGAAEDKELLAELDRSGVVPYARTNLSGGDEGSTLNESQDKAQGVSKFWDTTNWIFGLAYLLH